MEPVTNVTSHNARVAHIRRFTMQPPARATTLRLVALEDPPCVLGEWSRDELADNGAAAVELDLRIVEHSRTQEADVSVNLVWCGEGGAVVSSKRIRCRYEAPVIDEGAAVLEALGITGTERGERFQMQRLQEACMRMNISATQSSVSQLQSNNREVMAHNRELRTENAELRKMNALLLRELEHRAKRRRIEIDELADARAEEMDDDENEARPMTEEERRRAELFKVVTPVVQQMIPLAMQALAQHVQGRAAEAAITRRPPDGPPPAPNGAPRPPPNGAA